MKKLETSFYPSSPSEQLWIIHIKPWLISAYGAVERSGLAPPTDLERRLQEWLDDNSDDGL